MAFRGNPGMQELGSFTGWLGPKLVSSKSCSLSFAKIHSLPSSLLLYQPNVPYLQLGTTQQLFHWQREVSESSPLLALSKQGRAGRLWCTWLPVNLLFGENSHGCGAGPKCCAGSKVHLCSDSRYTFLSLTHWRVPGTSELRISKVTAISLTCHQ